MPAAEKCDAVDNDCNGMVDEGDNLCPAGEVCAQGVCVHFCDDSEFKCFGRARPATPTACARIRAASARRAAPARSASRGTCVGGCDGVMCPHGQVCRLGNCVAPCDGRHVPGRSRLRGRRLPAAVRRQCRSCDTGFSCNIDQRRLLRDRLREQDLRRGPGVQAAGQLRGRLRGRHLPRRPGMQDGELHADPAARRAACSTGAGGRRHHHHRAAAVSTGTGGGSARQHRHRGRRGGHAAPAARPASRRA